MAKIFKFSGYLVDKEGKTSITELMQRLVGDLIPQQIHVEIKELGELSDDSPLLMENCDLADCERHFPKDATKGNPTRVVEIGKTYRHFKGHLVKVIAISEDTEYLDNYIVVYEHLENGSVWHRPYDMFISEIDHEKYPDVKQKYRFELVE